jgi:hypothetical protein
MKNCKEKGQSSQDLSSDSMSADFRSGRLVYVHENFNKRAGVFMHKPPKVDTRLSTT